MDKGLPPVLLAAMALDLGGAETHVISLAHELHRRGHRVVVVSAGGRLVTRLTERGIPHLYAPLASHSPVDMARAYWILRQIIQTHQIGLVHAHARIPAWLVSLALKGRSVPFVTTYHGVYKAGFPWRYLTTFGQRTIAVSDDVREHLVQRLGAPEAQIRTIPNGYDLDQFRTGIDIAPLLQEFGVEAAGAHIVNASRMSGEMADVPIALMEAVALVEAEVPGLRLWVLGDGDRLGDVRRAAAKTNAKLGRSAVVVTGVRLDVNRFFNLADCVVAVARTAVEAMACERAVIVAGQGGYRGILTPERIEEYARSNFTAREEGQPLAAVQLAADLRHLLQPGAQDLRLQMGQAGRRYVVDHLSIVAITDRTLDVYAEVL
jgi:glycosyltransferase involved in cell wall biosynthesis